MKLSDPFRVGTVFPYVSQGEALGWRRQPFGLKTTSGHFAAGTGCHFGLASAGSFFATGMR